MNSNSARFCEAAINSYTFITFRTISDTTARAGGADAVKKLRSAAQKTEKLQQQILDILAAVGLQL